MALINTGWRLYAGHLTKSEINRCKTCNLRQIKKGDNCAVLTSFTIFTMHTEGDLNITNIINPIIITVIIASVFDIVVARNERNKTGKLYYVIGRDI